MLVHRKIRGASPECSRPPASGRRKMGCGHAIEKGDERLPVHCLQRAGRGGYLGRSRPPGAGTHPSRTTPKRMAPRIPDGVFERHLRDAVRLNRDRAPRYAELSDGRSRSVSRQLIATEILLLPLARWFDRRVRVYHRAGVPVIAALFVSMDTTPPFADELANPPGGRAARYPAANTAKRVWRIGRKVTRTRARF